MSNNSNGYDELLAHYKKMLELVDYFHFNSSVTRDVYIRYFDISKGKVVPITHSGIHDNREIKAFNGEFLRLGFIGNITPYKGFPLLKQILMLIAEAGSTDWQLAVYGGEVGRDKDSPNILFKGKFTFEEMKRIYSEMDMLVVPSLCFETFSLITLEALSFGVPVLVSDTVGAKDIVARYDSDFIFRTPEELKQKLENCIINRERLVDFNRQIMERPWLYSQNKHIDDIDKLYSELVE